MKFLVGYEGNDQSVRAVSWTVERARAGGDDLTVAVFTRPGGDRSVDALRTEVEAILADEGTEAAVQTIEGHPGSSLVELAERHDVDQLVIGGGTETPTGKVRLGSVTEFVVVNATTTVTLVR